MWVEGTEMTRIWKDPQDGKDWEVEINYRVGTSSRLSLGKPQSNRISFTCGDEQYSTDTILDPRLLEDLLDRQLKELLDAAQGSGP